jgi:hypothetical protein
VTTPDPYADEPPPKRSQLPDPLPGGVMPPEPHRRDPLPGDVLPGGKAAVVDPLPPPSYGASPPARAADPAPGTFSPGYGAAIVPPASTFLSPPDAPPNGRPDTAIHVPAYDEPQAHSGPRMISELSPLPIPVRSGAVLRGQPIRIGLWGATRSGKSTYLASLPLAGMMRRPETWTVVGTDDSAAEYLNHMVNLMVTQRVFPRPNRIVEAISWAFSGPPPATGLSALSHLIGRQPAQVEFVLELHDPPGRDYATVNPEVIEHLVNAHGVLYLVDPTLNQDTDMTFQAFFHAVQLLHRRLGALGRLKHGRLPHHIAVCITKFDDDHFFRRLATETDYVTQDSWGARLPRVPQERSREYFQWVCERVLGSGATMVRQALDAFFLPKRIEFFATTAIGFRLNGQGMFDFRDFCNADTTSEPARLRGLPQPVNVLEPLIFLERQIRRGLR